MSLKIRLTNTQRDLPLSMRSMRKVVSFLLLELGISTDEVIFHFVSTAKICALHKDFFNDPTPTDCITFPFDPPHTKNGAHHLLGEAFICPKTALLYARKHQIDPEEEVCRYVIHCLLHMIGYEDTTPAARAQMKRKERLCLARLKKL